MPKTMIAQRTTWMKVAFGDVVQLSRERSSDPERDGHERFIGLEHIDPGDLRLRRWGNVADGVTFTSVFRPGQVLFGKRRAYQRKVAVPDFSGVCSGDIYVLEPKGNALLPELLPFICQTEAFFEHAVGTSAGSLSPRTNWESLASFEFTLPPIEEQRRTVDVCKAADKALVSLHAVEAAARTQWLSSIEFFETRYSSDVRPLGLALSAIEPGRSVIGAERPRQSGEFAVLKVSAVDPLGFQPEESKVLLSQDEFMPEHSVRAGDILMTRSNTSELVGESCLVSSSHPSLMLCDKTLRLVPREGISPVALWHMLQSRRVREQIAAVATGTGGAMKNISQPKIRALQVCVPTEVRQAREIEEIAGSAYRAFLSLRSRRVASDIVRSSVVNRACGV